ncbi:MAG: class I SAM-dependent methyltransferase [Pseudomonadota bacterium]
MPKTIKAGIPAPGDYQAILQHPVFKKLEAYSNTYQSVHADLLRPYARKWVIDPLHQWSRQWEYPFMAEAIAQLQEETDRPLSILDAGAGMTFFPHYLLEQYPDLQLECCDIDASLENLYARVAARHPRHPHFQVADLTQLPYAENTFDAVYCVSVLEHIPGREKVMGEFFRVLKPGGKLILSFDLSLDGSRDISLPEARLMLAELDKYFDGTAALGLPAAGELQTSAIFTTEDARKIDARLLPWPYPALVYQIRGLLQGRGWMRWPPLLAVSCGVLTRKSRAQGRPRAVFV